MELAERSGATWEGQLGTPGGGEEREKQNGAFLVCGGTIGHRPLQGRCPKTRKICPKTRIIGEILSRFLIVQALETYAMTMIRPPA